MTAAIVPSSGVLLGRARVPGFDHPRVVTLRDGVVHDITARMAPTSRDVCERADPAGYVKAAAGMAIGTIDDILANCWAETTDPGRPSLLSPIDLQAVKASGVTFVVSLLERVIEEQARGDKSKADALREDILTLVGANLSDLVPGSPAAMKVKESLIAKGVWSQYLEVGIGPDAEIFTKSQPMSSVGWGADVGLHPISSWNNPEPEVAVVVTSDGRIVGATLGNDVNLRDFEGRSALLLSKAKDNNASCAIGPFVRLFDDRFGMDDVRDAVVELTIDGPEGYKLHGTSSMRQISRDPEDLLAQAMSEHHYPDGFVFLLGTLFAPTQDRDVPNRGFTHKVGDVVTISTPRIGTLVNRVNTAGAAPAWNFGIADLMRNLVDRGLVTATARKGEAA